MPLCYHAIHTFLFPFAHILEYSGVDTENAIKESRVNFRR